MQGFQRAIFIIGPTASGKTALAHTIADRLEAQGKPCELVNLDAFQFYRGVTAGTAKPSPEEVSRYRYHGIDLLDACDSIDAARYAEFVWRSTTEIFSRGRWPVCVGGSGLYLRAVLHGLDPLPPRNDDLRAMFRASAAAWGWPELHRWLEQLAPERAAQLHPNDKTRIERALEIAFQLPGDSSFASVFKKDTPLAQQPLVGEAYVIQTDCADDVLKQRISKRIFQMFEAGWFDEVVHLKHRYGNSFARSQAAKAIGYPELYRWIDALPEGDLANEHTLAGLKVRCQSELSERLSTLTWQYVRRQRTWNAKERLDWAVNTTCWIPEQFSFADSFVDFLSK